LAARRFAVEKVAAHVLQEERRRVEEDDLTVGVGFVWSCRV